MRALLTLFVLPAVLAAAVPDWLQQAAATPYQADAKAEAVVLFDEDSYTVAENGEVRRRSRQALKILRPQGKRRAFVTVDFDREQKILDLRGWTLPAAGKPYELKEKDAVERSTADDELYSERREKRLNLPAPDPGNIVAWEYEVRLRPDRMLQFGWQMQADIPVARSRMELVLPAGWEYKEVWVNHPAVRPTAAGPLTAWELRDSAPVEIEERMPALTAIIGQMLVSVVPPADSPAAARRVSSWQDVGRWYGALTTGRPAPDPAIKAKVAELLAGHEQPGDRLKVLTGFVQKEIRYVAIYLGNGGYQPHGAADVFRSRYGDCKDKSTLLIAMLQEAGISARYVLINTDRTMVRAEAASNGMFNHAIVAFEAPADLLPNAPSVTVNGRRLILFDPTDEYTPLGELSSSLQGGHALVVTQSGGELVPVPVAAPSLNRLMRTATLKLSDDGGLTGTVQEHRWGVHGARYRGALKTVQGADRVKLFEGFLHDQVASAKLTKAGIGNLDKPDEPLVMDYSFETPHYAQTAGGLLLVRPRVLGEKGVNALSSPEPRKHAISLRSVSLESDRFEIEFPANLTVDELPAPVNVENEYARYKAETKVEGHKIIYSRLYELKQVLLPAEKQAELRQFFGQVANDEASAVVLKNK